MKSTLCRRPERGARRPMMIALAVYMLLGVFYYDLKPAAGDNYDYALLGRALATGRGYVDIYMPHPAPSTHFPPGFPAMLAVIMKVFPGNYQALKLFVFLCGAVALAAAAPLFRGRLPAALAAAALAAAASNAVFLDFSHEVFSEAPFLAVLMLSLLLIGDEPERASWGRFAAGAALFAALYYIRSAAVMVLPGMALYLLARRAWLRLAVFCAIAALAAAPWVVRNSRVEQAPDTYSNQLILKDFYNPEAGRAAPADFARRWAVNAAYAAVYIPAMLAPQTKSALGGKLSRAAAERKTGLARLPLSLARRPEALPILALLGLAAAVSLSLALLLWGFAADARDGPRPYHFITVCYMFLICFWPSGWFHFRLILPVFLFLWLFAARGISEACGRLAPKRAWLPAAAAAALLVLGAAALVPGMAANTRSNLAALKGDTDPGRTPDWSSFYDAALWLKANTPPHARVMSRKPAIVYYYSGRTGFSYPLTTDVEQTRRFILENRPGYVIDDNFEWTDNSRKYLRPVIDQSPGAFTPVYRARGGFSVVYSIERSSLPEQ